MRVAFLPDLHLDDKKRLAQGPVLAALLEDVLAFEPDVIAFTGDLAGDTVPHKASVLERNRFLDALTVLRSKGAQIVICRGNHDYFGDWRWLSSLPGVIFVEGPEPELIEFDGCAFEVLPWIDRAAVGETTHSEGVRTAYLSALGEHRARIRALKAEGVPTLLLGHVADGKGLLRDGQPTVPTADPLVSVEELMAVAPFAFGAFGHYHFPQELTKNGRYVGSVFLSQFGEDAGKSWIAWEDGDVTLRPIVQPAKIRVEVDLERECVASVRPGGVLDGLEGVLLKHVSAKGVSAVADVRIVAEIPEDRFVECRGLLRGLVEDLGTKIEGSVTLAARVSRRAKVRTGASDVAAASSLEDKVRTYGTNVCQPGVGRGVLKGALVVLGEVVAEMEG